MRPTTSDDPRLYRVLCLHRTGDKIEMNSRCFISSYNLIITALTIATVVIPVVM
jgi:hypothetical protein